MEFLNDISTWLEAILVSISSNFWLTGGIIAQGGLPFWPVFLAASLGAILGDAISYGIGHLLKDRIKTVWPFRQHLGVIEKGEFFFARHGGKAIFIGRFITGVKAVIPGVAGMMGMPYAYFTMINVLSAFVWAGAHILPGMLLTQWLDSIGLSLELVIVVGAVVLTALFLLIHYWKPIVIALCPLLGESGRRLRARLQKVPAPVLPVVTPPVVPGPHENLS